LPRPETELNFENATEDELRVAMDGCVGDGGVAVEGVVGVRRRMAIRVSHLGTS